MLQSYTLLHKTSGNENISVLNFIKSNNLKVLLAKRKAVTMCEPPYLFSIHTKTNDNVSSPHDT